MSMQDCRYNCRRCKWEALLIQSGVAKLTSYEIGVRSMVIPEEFAFTSPIPARGGFSFTLLVRGVFVYG